MNNSYIYMYICIYIYMPNQFQIVTFLIAMKYFLVNAVYTVRSNDHLFHCRLSQQMMSLSSGAPSVHALVSVCSLSILKQGKPYWRRLAAQSASNLFGMCVL